MRSHAGCGECIRLLLLHVPQIFQRRKSDANKKDFEIKLNLTYRARSTLKIKGILTKVFCTFGPNLVILAQNEVNFDFEVKFDLEGQGHSPPQNNRDLNQGLLHIWSKFGNLSLNG